MGSPAFQRVLEYPGRLAYGCTDFTAAWPHGGTGLGFCDEIVLTGYMPVTVWTAEEFGVEPVEVVHGGEAWSITAIVRDGDEDAISKVFLNTEAGTTTQHRGVYAPGTNRAGTLLSGRVMVVAFTPESVIQGYEDAHDMAVFYRAIPAPGAAMQLKHRLGAERLIPIAIYAIRENGVGGRSVAIRRRRDLANP